MFNTLLNRYGAEFDSTMRRVVDIAAEKTPGFGVMLRYPFGWVDPEGTPTIQSAGKRIRPLLLLLATEAADGNWRSALPAAAAVEILHNFSLVHDDIQDNSPTRHGRPTVWKVWGNADAINAGDALLCLAFTALELLSQQGIAAATLLRAWRVFNAMTLELTRGQYLDMNFEHREQVSVEEYLSMIAGKSAALIAASAEIGALIATNDAVLAALYGQFGLSLGIAFQIRDDILGIWGDPEITGKSAATDILSRKKSLPVLYGLAQSQALAALYQRETFGSAEVNAAVALLDGMNAQEYARAQETLYYNQALRALESAKPAGQFAQSLRQFVDLLFQRDY